jgi:hypothetical protein
MLVPMVSGARYSTTFQKHWILKRSQAPGGERKERCEKTTLPPGIVKHAGLRISARCRGSATTAHSSPPRYCTAGSRHPTLHALDTTQSPCATSDHRRGADLSGREERSTKPSRRPRRLATSKQAAGKSWKDKRAPPASGRRRRFAAPAIGRRATTVDRGAFSVTTESRCATSDGLFAWRSQKSVWTLMRANRADSTDVGVSQAVLIGL